MEEELKVKFTGFAPDLDFTTPGVIVDCDNIVPSVDGNQLGNQQNTGFRNAPGLVSIGMPALAAECRGAGAVRLLDNARRVFAGTQTKLYEASTGVWTDQSRSGDYTGGAQNRWRFAQFGNSTFAANRTDEMQVSNGSGAFDDVGGDAPKASILESVNGFLMAFDTNDPNYGDSPDRWWCSALQNPTDWTPSIAMQSATNRLTDTPGPITAARRFGDEIIVYKLRSMYRGRYVGPDDIWAFTLIPTEIGALNQESVIALANAHIFAGPDGFYLFDGSLPIPIGSDLSRWWQIIGRDLGNAHKAFAVHDRDLANIYFFYPSRHGNGTIRNALVFNYILNAWGKLDRDYAFEAGLQFISAVPTYDSLGSSYPTWDALPQISYDSPYWTAGVEIPTVFRANHTPYALMHSLFEDSQLHYLRTGWTGDEQRITRLLRVRPWMRYLFNATNANLNTCAHTYARALGDDTFGVEESESSNYQWPKNQYDFKKSARWHQLQFSFRRVPFSITGFTGYFRRRGNRG